MIGLFVGLLHAAVLLLVALRLGYDVGPSAYSRVGLGWRYGGLVLVAAVPVWLAVRYRIIAPLVAVALTIGYVLGMELTPPGPTFHDVAEFERLDEPTGIVVVENGLYIVRYMVNASVWMVGFLFLGIVEYAARRFWTWLPDVSSPIPLMSLPASRRQAAIVAAGGGFLHAFVMLWFSLRLGLSAGGSEWLLYTVSTAGMWLLAAVPLYLLVRRRLVAPATLLTVFVLLDVQSDFTASVDDPHALYFGAWFVYLAVLLAAAAIEYVLRRLDVVRQVRSVM